jgi:uncharacterized protein YlxW (UPF0749 family)
MYRNVVIKRTIKSELEKVYGGYMNNHIQENADKALLENWVPREWVRIWRRKDRERKREVKSLQASIAQKKQRIRELEMKISEITKITDK